MKRIRYYDLLRVVCSSMIVYYHMVVQLEISGVCDPDALSRYYSTVNAHVATLAVAVFFMLSGAGLGISNDKNFSVKTFYRRRFIRLLIPYYIVVLLIMLIYMLKTGSPFGYMSEKPAFWRLIFTVFGIDGWLSRHGVATFSPFGVGEWFLGVLIVLYLLFPLLRILIKKYPKFLFIAATVIYAIVIVWHDSHPDYVMPIHMDFFLKGYEFIIGLYLGLYGRQISVKWCALTIPICVFLIVCPINIPISMAIKITLLATCFFISFSILEKLLQKRIFKFIELLSSYSYELFLVHHVSIYGIMMVFGTYINSKKMILFSFLAELVCMIVATIGVKYISDRTIKLINKKIPKIKP